MITPEAKDNFMGRSATDHFAVLGLCTVCALARQKQGSYSSLSFPPLT